MSYLIAVISDSHGFLPDEKVLNDKLARADMLIHCGDGYRDGEDIAACLGKPIVQVLGNNDFVPGKHEEVADVYGHRIYITHGHYQRVKWGREVLASDALRKNATIACYGHTHVYEYAIVGGIHVFNPGNLTPSERQREGTIGFIRLYDNGRKPDFWYEVIC